MRVSAEEVLAKLGQADLQLIDARDPGQYGGTRRRGPRGGHIPGALNLPRELFFAGEGGFLPLEEIRERIGARGLLRPEAPTIAYCNGGVAATVVLFKRGPWFSRREKSRTLLISRLSRSASPCSVARYSVRWPSSRMSPPVSMSR